MIFFSKDLLAKQKFTCGMKIKNEWASEEEITLLLLSVLKGNSVEFCVCVCVYMCWGEIQHIWKQYRSTVKLHKSFLS